jgi:hypothetical protein
VLVDEFAQWLVARGVHSPTTEGGAWSFIHQRASDGDFPIMDD